MQWRDECIILSLKAFSESSRIVTVFNKSLGKTSGLVNGMKASIQPGDVSDVSWRGRSAERLGTLTVENVFSPFVHVFKNSSGIFAIDSACSMCRNGMPEKAPHPELFDELKSLMLAISRGDWIVDYVFFEMKFLSEVGFGLDLSKCALTGATEGLAYISPKTGCAVTAEAGEKYKDKLFKLPDFLLPGCRTQNRGFSVLKEDGFRGSVGTPDELLHHDNTDFVQLDPDVALRAPLDDEKHYNYTQQKAKPLAPILQELPMQNETPVVQPLRLGHIFLALKITGHFLRSYFCGINNKTLPFSRDCLIESIL
ncbi:hypothetical protein FACS1894122_09760 [Alphaproteobacteria bacterium]|nr:hypothetical protein FACS1894122_09760 [Alphaproteobacteria bacterium]